MASKQFTFAYGHGTKTFDYEENDILKVVRTEDFPKTLNKVFWMRSIIRLARLLCLKLLSRVIRLLLFAMTRHVLPTVTTSCRCLSMK